MGRRSFFLTKSDDLNNWADSTSLALVATTVELTATVADSLNNWNDAVSLILGIHLTFADSLSNWGDAVELELVASEVSSIVNTKISIGVIIGVS